MSPRRRALPKRPAARLLITDPEGRLLLFRFTPPDRPPFWGMPGGALDPGESYEEAARRELREETGYDLDPGPCIAVKHATFRILDGTEVDAEEHFFTVRLPDAQIDTTRQTPEERALMQVHRWWTLEELAEADEHVFPDGLADLWQAVRRGEIEGIGR